MSSGPMVAAFGTAWHPSPWRPRSPRSRGPIGDGRSGDPLWRCPPSPLAARRGRAVRPRAQPDIRCAQIPAADARASVGTDHLSRDVLAHHPGQSVAESRSCRSSRPRSHGCAPLRRRKTGFSFMMRIVDALAPIPAAVAHRPAAGTRPGRWTRAAPGSPVGGGVAGAWPGREGQDRRGVTRDHTLSPTTFCPGTLLAGPRCGHARDRQRDRHRSPHVFGMGVRPPNASGAIFDDGSATSGAW